VVAPAAAQDAPGAQAAGRGLPRRLALTALWGLPFLIFLAGAMVYPIFTLRDDTPEQAKPVINGLAFLDECCPDEAAAALWIRQNTAPSDIVLTAVGGAYDDTGRINAITGRPTLLGWDGSHEQLWRGGSPKAM